MIKLVLALCIFSQIKEIEPYRKYEIEIVTRKTDEYVLVTKDQPINFTVEGPTYLRVYTRIFWPTNELGSEIYKIILEENRLEEKIITLESEKSKVTRDKKGRALSKWRSFYIEVPEGTNQYALTHWSSPNDTILVKISYESPKKWVEIGATEYNSTIEAIEEEKILKYYELKRENGVTVRINGPTRIRVICRLNYDDKMIGDQNFTINVDDNGETESFALKCYKSQIITYQNRKNIVPSNARSFYLNLKEGQHTLRFNLSGTIAESAALRFMIEEK